MPDDVKTAVDGLMTAFETFKETNDQNTKKRDVLFDEKLDRINKTMDRFEEQNQKLTLELAEARKAADSAKDLQEQVDKIETKLNRPGQGSGDVVDWRKGDKHTAFIGWMRLGNERTPAERMNVMTLSDDTGGGYLAVPEYVQEIIKPVTEMSPMRSVVRVRTTGQKSLMIPRRSGLLTASWVGEIETRTEATGQGYAMEDIPMHEMTAELYFSMANLEDSEFNLETEFRSDCGEAFGVKEGNSIVLGSGVKQPEGFLTAAGTLSTNSGGTAITADSLIDVKYKLKTAYAKNGMFALNRNSLGNVRKLKDGYGAYIWMPGLAQGRPNTIDGDPYVEVPDMPNQGAGAKPVAYGDWYRAYTLVDRLAIATVRDGLTRANVGQVKFVARRRLGGQVVLAEAIAILICQ